LPPAQSGHRRGSTTPVRSRPRAASRSRDVPLGCGRSSGAGVLPWQRAGDADLIPGQVDINFDGIGASLPTVPEGQTRALAATTAARTSVLPDLPAVAESGFTGFAISGWFGLFAPTGTPEMNRFRQLVREADLRIDG
jgi:hypothetical protein